MALSQIQCLNDDHVNARINESKPEFLYSEDHRIALEKLLQDGPAEYEAYLKTQDMRGFLSDHELEYLSRTVTVYNPGGTDQLQIDGVGKDTEVASEYWPERSDNSLSELELGWPDITSYRGVTRATVYTHPPMDGQPHIKELIRKTIMQAQKVIGIVMDLFTDVDIFRDLLDISFRRRVAVYIILEATGVPHFLHMCQRAGMHKGHLKNLRVNYTRGAEFYSRSSKKVCGVVGQKFMFVDGDKSVSGSYSYTWTASRLDRNVVTFLTGQAVETFDRLFRDLFFTSRAVNLSSLKLDEEPEPEPARQAIQNPQVTAAMARKMYSAKYALLSSSSLKSSGTYSGRISSGHTNPLPLFFRQPKLLVEEPVIHPGLVGLQRANMINYLPTWPEPEPPSDVIGIINIRDGSKPFQAHLMRSELFETSQAIRFKEPLHMREEPLPEKATPRPHLELADVLSSVKTDQQPVQPLKTKGEGLRIADLISQPPFRLLHDQDSVLTPPVGNPTMVPLSVVNECDSHTAGVKGDTETKVNPEDHKDLPSPPGFGIKSEQPQSTASNRPGRGTVDPTRDSEKTRSVDTGIHRADSKSNINGSRTQPAKNSQFDKSRTMDNGIYRTDSKSNVDSSRAQLGQSSSSSDKRSECNGNVSDKSKPAHINGLHKHSENLLVRHGCQQKIDKKHIQNSKTTKETTTLPMTNGNMDTKPKPHTFESSNRSHQNGIKEPTLCQPPISGQKENSPQKSELQNNHLNSEDARKTDAHLYPEKKTGQEQDMVERHVNHLMAERNETAPVVLENEHKGNSSQQTLLGRGSRFDLLLQEGGCQYAKGGLNLNSSELKERKEKTELTSNNKHHALPAKEGRNICQDTQWVPEEVLFISEDDDEQKEMDPATQSKPHRLFKKTEQAVAPSVGEKLRNSSLRSKRDQATKTEGKHSGLTHAKAESSPKTTTATTTTTSGAEKQVERKGQLSHGISTSNLAATKVKGEAGRQPRDKMEKSHYRSTPDLTKQLKAESKSGTHLQASKKEGVQTPAHHNKLVQEGDRDLQERNAHDQARSKMESAGKKVYRASPNLSSRTPLANRTEGSARSSSVKTDTTPPTTRATSLAKGSLKNFQGKMFSSKPVNPATTSIISASSSTLSLNGPVLARQMAGQTNSPLGQSMPVLDKSKAASSTSKSPLSLQKLLPLRSLKERITRTPSQKKLAVVGKKV